MPAEVSTFQTLVQTFGWPGAMLVVILIGGWRAWVFVKPWAEKMFLAYISRQEQIAASQKDLAAKSMDIGQQSIEIQKSVAKSVESIPAAIERLLRAIPPPANGQK